MNHSQHSSAIPGPGGFTSLPPNHDHDPAATAAAALTHEHDATPNGNARKRKAPTSVPGSRGVANLTPDQLAKKRANDREAQRAIRQRTKDTIDTLANRIKELESQQPFQELQKVCQERDRALQECEDLKKKLATITSVIGSTNGNGNSTPPPGQQQQQQQQQPNLHELAAVTAQQSPLPPLNTSQPGGYPQPNQHSSAGAQQYEHQQHLHPDLRSPRSATVSSPGSQGGGAHYSPGPGMRRWSPTLDQQPTSHYSPPQNGVGYNQQAPSSAPQSNGERLGLSYVLEPKNPKGSPPLNQPQQQQYTSSPPLWSRLPNNTLPSCPLDSLLLDFFAGRRAKYNEGIPMADVAGPEYPYLYALLDPTAVYTSKHCHPLSALLIDILSKFPYIDALPEKVAVLYIMFLVLRWEICPCERCFEQIPMWARPVKEQLEIPHSAWHDHVPWPTIRRNLVLLNKIKFEDFFIPFTSKICLNWPYPKDQVLIPAQPPNPDDPNALAMNPVFESHLRDLNNWSLGTIFRNELGELIDESVRIEDEGVGMPVVSRVG